jgi:hypothetical protein
MQTRQPPRTRRTTDAVTEVIPQQDVLVRFGIGIEILGVIQD